MKLFLAVIAVFAVVSVYSQTTSEEDFMDAQITRRLMEQPPSQDVLVGRLEKPNEIRMGNVTYDGILVQIVRTDNLIQLINPAAPPEYGSPEDNTARDAISGRVTGLKLLSFKF